jgi:hypothetical protein
MALENLKPIQLKAAAFLAAGTSCKDAAEQCEVTPETISHWKRNSDFVAHLNQLKKDAVECARERLRNLVADAIGVLEDLLGSPSDSIRFRASQYILDAMLIDPKRAKEGIGSTDPTLVRMSMLDFT